MFIEERHQAILDLLAKNGSIDVYKRQMKYFKAEGIAERTHDGVVILDKQKLLKLAL